MSILIKGFTLNKQFASYSYNWFYCLDLTTLSWCWDFWWRFNSKREANDLLHPSWLHAKGLISSWIRISWSLQSDFLANSLLHLYHQQISIPFYPIHPIHSISYLLQVNIFVFICFEFMWRLNPYTSFSSFSSYLLWSVYLLATSILTNQKMSRFFHLHRLVVRRHHSPCSHSRRRRRRD